MAKPLFIEFRLTERQVKLIISCLCSVLRYAPSYEDLTDCIDVLAILRKRLNRSVFKSLIDS